MTPYTTICASTDRSAWLAARDEFLTASDISTVLGLNEYDSPLALYCRKVGTLPEKDQTEAMEMGLELEPTIIRIYQRRTTREVRPAGFLLQSNAHPWLAATLDAWTVKSVDVPLECKAPGFARTDDWDEGVPSYYLPQVQAQMLVTGCDEASVAALIGGQRFRWCDVQRDDEACRRIVEVGYEFWCRVREGRPPEPTGMDADDEAIRALFPNEKANETVTLGENACLWTRRCEEIDEQLKSLNKERSEVRQHIKSTIGECRWGVLPDGSKWKFSTVNRKGYTVEATSHRELRRVGR